MVRQRAPRESGWECRDWWLGSMVRCSALYGIREWLAAGRVGVGCAMNAHPTGVGAGPTYGGGAVGYRIFWPVFAQSAMNCSSPLSVRTWDARALITAGGAVTTSAPIRAQSLTWLAVRIEAARIWVLKS
jgi:hypothetical protein